MDNNTDSTITASQYTLILIGSMVGVGVLNLPNNVVKNANQDGWMSCIFGVLYPAYMVFIGNYMCRKFPNKNVLALSKEFLGNFLGEILNIIFISFFIFLTTSVASGVSNVLLTYTVPFLNNYKILALIFLIPAFISHSNIRDLGRVNEVVFYATIMLFFIPISALKYGSVLNLMPVLGSGLINIAKASKETFFAYTGIEILFLIYPFLDNKKKMKKSGVISIVFIAFIYTYFTLVTIFYLGVDIIPKFIWSIATVSESVYVPVINNFRYIFILMWTIVMFKTISNFYYSISYSLSETIRSGSRKKIAILIYPVIFYISAQYGNTTIRSAIIDKITPIYVIFNICYVSIIAILITLKKGDKNEKKVKE